MSAKVKLPLSPQCAICRAKDGLSKCAGCKALWYCSGEHQTIDWQSHKALCNPVRRTLSKLEKEDERLRNLPGDVFFAQNPFENSVGHFWGILETRDYMRARFAHVEALLKIKTSTAVQAALDHLLDMLRLCRSDNTGVRDLIPAILLRLDKDQECYDFIKWYSTSGQDAHYDWGDMALPFLDIKDADAFEPIEPSALDNWAINHNIGLTLLKIKMLLDLRGIHNAAAIGEKVPREILDSIRGQLVSTIIAKNVTLSKAIDDGEDLGHFINTIESHVNTMCHAVKSGNQHFWSALVNPGRNLTARPDAYSHGSTAQMQLALHFNYDAWEETPGAIDFIKVKVQE